MQTGIFPKFPPQSMRADTLNEAATVPHKQASSFTMAPRSSPKHNGMVVWVLCALAILASCGVISPRRIVVNNPPNPSPSVSPTPNPFPTPTISPTPTATPTPTPTGMSAVVPKQFLFTADPAAGVILGFQINRDGGLSAVPGSPFMAPNSPRLLVASGKDLFVANQAGLTAFAVNRETGSITRLDSVALPSITSLTVDSGGTVSAISGTRRTGVRVVNNKLQLGSVSGIMLLRPGASTAGESGASPEVKDASGQFFYLLDPSTGEISSSRIENGKMIPLRSFAAGHGAVSLTIAVP